MTTLNGIFVFTWCIIFLAGFKTSEATFGASCTTDANCNTPSETCSGSNCACSSGYVHDGNGVCEAVDCGAPTDPTQGSISYTTTVYQDTGTVTCNAGYTLSGSSTITCQAAGSWSTIPTCNAKSSTRSLIGGGLLLWTLPLFFMCAQMFFH